MKRLALLAAVTALAACTDPGAAKVVTAPDFGDCKVHIAEVWGFYVVASPNCSVGIR
ncbi:hypothetical protein VAC51_00018 [Variovorax phage VAC_51]|uniref:Lipoprotein n=1 Tax=Variovorax phage VAC_51 TaxID=2985242 RepID=A0A9N6WVK4_9CAUD|nr:hypothetical protein VAC51_00018 [Variovorax phage VAC_51]